MKKLHIPTLGRCTRAFLRGTLPILVLVCVSFLLAYLDAREQNAMWANVCFAPMLEYLTASAVILLVGAVLIETADRKG